MNINKTFFLVGFIFVVFGMFFVSSKNTSASVISTLSGRDLYVGARGADVIDLQGLLSELGYLNVPQGVPFGYFGPLTKNSLARYQNDLGVSPSVGYYGPITKSNIISSFEARGWLDLLRNNM